MSMKRVNVVVEGETERDFITENIAPLFAPDNVLFHYNLLHGVNLKDGWGKIRNEIIMTILNDSSACCTTMLDLYGLPEDTPGKDANISCPIQRAEYIEKEISKHIVSTKPELDKYVNTGEFIPYIQVHEFEALLFSAPEHISPNLDADDKTDELIRIKNSFESPEHINDSKITAPSKRLKSLFGNTYQKPLCGNLIVMDIGFEIIREECKHFNDWVQKLEQLK